MLPSVTHHSFYIAVKLFTIKWSLQSHFIWRCDGDLLQWNLMFILDIYTSDSHLDSAIWINSSKNVHVHLQECHSYINQASFTETNIVHLIFNFKFALKFKNNWLAYNVDIFIHSASLLIVFNFNFTTTIYLMDFLFTWILFICTADCCSLCNVTYMPSMNFNCVI